MSDPFDTHTHGRFYGVAPCQSCKAKDAEIERLRAAVEGAEKAFLQDGDKRGAELMRAALEDE